MDQPNTSQSQNTLSEHERTTQAHVYLYQAYQAYTRNDPGAALGFEQRAFVIMGKEYRAQFGNLLRQYCVQLLQVMGSAWLQQALNLLRRVRNLMPNSPKWVESVLALEAELCASVHNDIARDDALLSFYYLRSPASLFIPVLEKELRGRIRNDLLYNRFTIRRAALLATTDPRCQEDATALLDQARKLLHSFEPSETRATAAVEIQLVSALLRRAAGESPNTVQSFLEPVRLWAETHETDAFFGTFFREYAGKRPPAQPSSDSPLPRRKEPSIPSQDQRKLVVAPRIVPMW